PSAGRTAKRWMVDALLEEQQLDATVRSGLERPRPAGRGAAVPARLFAPVSEHLGLVLCLRTSKDRRDGLEQLRRARVGFGVRPPDDRLTDLGRELLHELRACLLRA